MYIKAVAILFCAAISMLAQSGSYLGPSILSRGGSATGDRAGVHTGFEFYGGVYGTYETGLVPASVDSQGRIISPDSLMGVGADMGGYGRRTFRHTTIGLDYTGNYRHYTSNTYYDGSDHALSLHISNQTTRRLQLQGMVNAGTISQYFVAGPASAADLISNPNYGIFDNRAYYLEGTAGFRYRMNSRLSFTGNGTGFGVRRQSKSLVGLNGYSAQGVLEYRLNRTRSVNAFYSYSHFDYPRGFGESDLHTYMVGMQQAFGRRWEGGLAAGASQISTIGLEQVAVDPLTAALFGTPVSVQAFSRTLISAAGRAMLAGKFKTSRLEFAYSQLPSAGNGVYLTSRSNTGDVTFSYNGFRRASLSLRANYNRLGSVGQQSLGTFTYVSGGGGASYKILGALEATAQFDSRNVQVDQNNGFARLSYRVRFGLNWHPGEIPISLW